MVELTRRCAFIDKNSTEKPGQGVWLYVSQIPSDLIDQVKRLQTSLQEQFGSDVWLHPADKLHMTAVVINDAFAVSSMSSGQLDVVQASLRRVLTRARRFEITFDKVLFTPDVIGIQASNAEQLNSLRSDIRSSLVNLLPEHALPKPMQPEIAHITGVRFLDQLSMDEVRAKLTDIPLQATTLSVHHLDLVAVSTVPTGVTLIETFSLGN